METIGNSYICGLCGERYHTKKEALACEFRHVGGPVRIKSVHYSTPKQNHSVYPEVIKLVMADGSTQTYVFSEEK